jgi:two-component system, chemotaxis family, sensor kinase CheA
MVEFAGDAQVVQYRGQIMPLLRVSDVLVGRNANGRANGNDMRDLAAALQVVVYSEQGRSVGLVVDRILDIVEETIVPQQPSKHDGLLGSAVIQQRVTDLLDVRGFVRTANPDFFDTAVTARER